MTTLKSIMNTQIGVDQLSIIPLELLRMMLVLLPRNDLINLGLSSRSLHNATSEVLFTSITIRNDVFSQRQLETISATPFWANQVRSINWYSFSKKSVYGGRFDSDATSQNVNDLLDLCKFLDKLPNVKKLQFTVQHVENLDLFCDPRVYHAIQNLEIRPAVIQIDDMVIRNSPTKQHQLRDLDVSTVITSHGKHYITFPRVWLEHPIKSGATTLRRVILSDIPFHLDLLKVLLYETEHLNELSLDTVRLASSVRDEHGLHKLLSYVRHCKNRAEQSPCRLDFQHVRVAGYSGIFSATDNELTRWATWVDDRWIRDVAVAHQPGSWLQGLVRL